MSQQHQQQETEVPVVVHGPITGDPERAANVVRPVPAMIIAESLAPATFRQPRLVEAPVVSVAPAERVLGLDAFRGLLILVMNFAFTIPDWGPFPGWMYHMQVPPSPSAAYAALAGLTWRDMQFPMFLFTMAAAVPVVMGARLANGKPYPEILWIAARRAFLLTVFALIIGHVNPYWTQDVTKRGNLIAIVGLLVAFAFFVQAPRSMGPVARRWLRRVAWAAVALTLFVLPLLYGKTFDPLRKDEIIASIAFCTLATTVLWLFTRERPVVRLAALAVLVAGRAVAPHVAWFGEVWYARPLPWFYEPWYLELMLIAIIGTIAGDLVVRFMRAGRGASVLDAWSRGRAIAITALGLSFFVTLSVGLYQRQYPLQTTLAVIVTCAALLALVRGAASERERAVARMVAWASVWLVAGMLVEPLEGGIKKDPQTLGYLLVMGGVASAALASMLVLLDGFRAAGTKLRALVLVGQNSLFAYVVFMLGIGHLLWLTGAGNAFTQTWPVAAARSVVLTIISGTVVWLATRRRLIWKT